ncbi:MAG: sialidase family protein [Planctomycetaceae bacterium]
MSSMPRRRFLQYSCASVAATCVPNLSSAAQKEVGSGRHQVGRKIIVEDARKIYSTRGEKLQYNSFTNMALWRGTYYIVTRQALHHGPSESRIVLLQSRDLRTWDSQVIIDTETDDRDPKLFATQNRLIVYSDAFHGGGSQEQIMARYTRDGQTWSALQPIYKPAWQLWKPKTYQGVHYVAADCIRCGHVVRLLRSDDGISWTDVAEITVDNKPTETAIAFDTAGRMYAVVRQNTTGHPPRALVSDPPYREWKHVDGTGHFSGPAIERVGQTLVVSSRTLLPDWGLKSAAPLGPQRTALYTLNTENLQLELQAILPTEQGGDSSYPGILPLSDRRALVCWHDGSRQYASPNPSNIWLARIRIND